MNDKKFLALTAITDLWDLKKDIVMLGDWCLVPANKEVSSGLNYTVIGHDKKKEDFAPLMKRLEAFNSVFVKALGRALDIYHGENHREVYWEHLLREWCLGFIASWYRRYEEIKDAVEELGCFETAVYDTDEAVAPCSISEAGRIKKEGLHPYDVYNAEIYKRIIRGIGKKYDITVRKVLFPGIGNKEEFPQKIKKVRLRNKIYGLVSRRCPVIVLNTVMGSDPRRLKNSLVGKVYFSNNSVPEFETEGYKKDISKRAAINIEYSCENEFEEIIAANIKDYLPVTVVEAYRDIEDYYKRNFPRTPVVAVMQGGSMSSFSVCMAGFREKGSKIAGLAHAPLQNIKLYPAEEEPDCDLFYIWGRETDPVQKKSPTFKYAGPDRDSYSRTRIRWFMDPNSFNIRYPGGFIPYEVMHSGVRSRIGRLIKEFASSLKEDIRKELVYRLRDYSGYGVRELLSGIIPELSFEEVGAGNAQRFGGSVSELIYDSRLIICESFETSVFFEALIRNVPTVVLSGVSDCDTYLTDIALDAQRKLKEAGILFDDGNRAAEFINGCGDFDAWWGERKRQRLVRDIGNDFMYHIEDSCSYWEKELRELAGQ